MDRMSQPRSPNGSYHREHVLSHYCSINFRTGESETVGNLTDTDVTNQLQVLNDSFRPYGDAFSLIGTTRTDNSSWYYNNSLEMRSTLHVGDASTLNVYFTDAFGFSGFAQVPWDYERRPDYDGVVVNSVAITGGAAVRRNEGKTLVHEAGHWLGLLHTFQIRSHIIVRIHCFVHFDNAGSMII